RFFTAYVLLFFFILRTAPLSPLFPYTTLFRSLAIIPYIDRELPVASDLLPDHHILAGKFLRCRTFAFEAECADLPCRELQRSGTDRKSTRLNSSHDQISYAVFCLKKKKIIV